MIFHKVRKDGTPNEVYDDRISNYIIESIPMFVLEGQLYIYNKGVYKRDDRFIKLKDYIKQLILPDVRTMRIINRVCMMIVEDIRLKVDMTEINQFPKHWINFKNGMFDILGWKLYKHKPEYLSINQVPHDFEPIDNEGFNNSVYNQFIPSLLQNDEDVEMLYEYIGYCMTCDTSQQKFLMITGPGGTGKSTIVRMIEYLIGKDNISNMSLQDLNTRFTPTNLFGKLLNSCSDISRKAIEQTDVIKKITGEDTIQGEYKGGAVIFFKSYAKLLFSANEIPISLDDKTNAFFRRFLILHIDKKGRHIDGLEKRLKGEIKYLIFRSVGALREMYSRGNIIESEQSKKAVDELYRFSDSVQDFIAEQLEECPGEKIKRSLLYEAYEEHCNENGRIPVSRKAFSKNLELKGYKTRKRDGIRYVQGFKFKDTDFEPTKLEIFGK